MSIVGPKFNSDLSQIRKCGCRDFAVVKTLGHARMHEVRLIGLAGQECT